MTVTRGYPRGGPSTTAIVRRARQRVSPFGSTSWSPAQTKSCHTFETRSMYGVLGETEAACGA